MNEVMTNLYVKISLLRPANIKSLNTGKANLACLLTQFTQHKTSKCKKTSQFKTVFNGDTAYTTQLKQQKSKRCYYVGAR